MKNVSDIFREAYEYRNVLLDKELISSVEKAVELLIETLKNGNKILVAGNGGSSADSQHLVGELVGRFLKERRALPGIALTTNTSILTAIGNDYSFDRVFSRQVEALGNRGDALIVISTSGNALNLISAVNTAKSLSINTIGLLGCDGGKLGGLVDIPIIVRLNSTPRIQEIHIVIIHTMCELIEAELCK
ncbi:D-sedoheptulose 7-phosphate isomerase [bacterium]|nr:D-sedoheptulose 7-phosphate isomerase [bacterium]